MTETGFDAFPLFAFQPETGTKLTIKPYLHWRSVTIKASAALTVFTLSPGALQHKYNHIV
jgi:hypothetical protein